MRKIITVGMGDYYNKNISPAFNRLKKEGRVEHIATVDTKTNEGSDIVHIVRKGESLSETLKKFRNENPIVLLAHSNHMHAPDAIDLSNNGFDVAVEKPFALSVESLKTFLRSAKKGKYFLLEYYLQMKSAPLLFALGKIKLDSFFYLDGLLHERTGLKKYSSSLKDFHGKLNDLIGNVESISEEILEGDGKTGKLDHRGASLVDIRAGGGMIQDLGVHALAPIYAMGPVFGGMPYCSNTNNLQIAISHEYATMAKEIFGLEKGYIAESFAQFQFFSRTGVPVQIRVGKYIIKGKNRRGIKINGSKNNVFLDMNECVLYIGDDPVLGISKDSEKYYSVIRSAIDFFEGKNVYNFDSNKSSSKAQEMVLKIQDEAYRSMTPVYYDSHMEPDDIFKN